MMGRELRKARQRAGLTQERLSFLAGLSRPYISELERDLKSPTVDTLFRICDALNASAADLIARADAARKRKPRP
jgi:transcriptional regulator with XRE-family HTH domain